MKLLKRDNKKLQKLRETFRELDINVKGEPEKLVIVSEFPIICLSVIYVSSPHLSFFFSLCESNS
jgi:hypothetical protein